MEALHDDVVHLSLCSLKNRATKYKANFNAEVEMNFFIAAINDIQNFRFKTAQSDICIEKTYCYGFSNRHNIFLEVKEFIYMVELA